MEFYREEQTIKHVGPDGAESEDTVSKRKEFYRETEPNYIKLYSRMWCEFNGIPMAYRELFLCLAHRMNYANSDKMEDSQTVYVIGPAKAGICSELGWGERMLQKGLKALCDCGAIRKFSRGVYQINPSYAGKGEWAYSPSKQRGGIKEMIVQFNLSNHEVATNFPVAPQSTITLRKGDPACADAFTGENAEFDTITITSKETPALPPDSGDSDACPF